MIVQENSESNQVESFLGASKHNTPTHWINKFLLALTLRTGPSYIQSTKHKKEQQAFLKSEYR